MKIIKEAQRRLDRIEKNIGKIKTYVLMSYWALVCLEISSRIFYFNGWALTFFGLTIWNIGIFKQLYEFTEDRRKTGDA